MKTSIVIPNYNGLKLLEKNLPKILNLVKDYKKCEVIIVDDASTDESVNYIKYQISNIKNTKQKPKIKLIQNEKNLGFASTVNRGVKETKGELVLLLNSDVVPEKDFLPPLIKHFSDPKVFAVGCLQKSRERKKIVLRGRGIGDFKRGFLLHARGAVNSEDSSEVSERTCLRRQAPRMVEELKKTLWVSGGAGIFRKKIWESLGGLNPLYNPFYWEDIDLSYRALKAGYLLFFESKSIVNHYPYEGSIRNTYPSFFVKTIAYRNQVLFVWLNITDILYLLQHIFFLPFHFLKAIITFDFAFIYGFLLAVIRLPKVIKSRYRNKRWSKISDREILDK